MLKINPFILFEEEADGSGFLCNPETNRVQRLNRIGVIIWKQLEDGADSAEAIAIKLSTVFPSVPQERLLHDTQAFLAMLQAYGLLAS